MQISKDNIALVNTIALFSFIILPYNFQSIMLILVTLLNLVYVKQYSFEKENKVQFLILNFWVFFTMLSLLWSDNFQFAIKNVQKLLTYIFISFNIIFLLKKNIKNTYVKIYIGFIILVWITLITHEINFIKQLYLDNFWHYLKTPFNFINQIGVYDIDFFIDFHKAYMSSAMLIANTLILFIYNKTQPYLKILFVLIFIHFTIEIFHMMSIINVFLQFVLLGVLFINFIVTSIKKKKIKLIIGLVVILVLSVVYITRVQLKDNNVNRKIEKAIAFIKSEEKEDKASRKDLWLISIAEAKKQILFGYGVGDTQDVLIKAYNKLNLNKLSNRKINSHNQYIYNILIGGIVNLIFFIALIIYVIRKVYHNLFYLFIVIILLSNLFLENFLFRINGIWIFTLFISIITLVPLNNTSKQNEIEINS